MVQVWLSEGDRLDLHLGVDARPDRLYSVEFYKGVLVITARIVTAVYIAIVAIIQAAIYSAHPVGSIIINVIIISICISIYIGCLFPISLFEWHRSFPHLVILIVANL